jgi:hypothetical protein
MGQVVDSWANTTTIELRNLFDGSDESLNSEETMSYGKLIEGEFERDPPEGNITTFKNDLPANIQKCYFGYFTPTIWQASKSYAFTIDAGHAWMWKQRAHRSP